MQNKQALGSLLSEHNMALQYLSARTGAYGRCGAAHILNLDPAGQNPETLGNLLVTDPPGGVGGRERQERTEKKQRGDAGKHEKGKHGGRMNKRGWPMRPFCFSSVF